MNRKNSRFVVLAVGIATSLAVAPFALYLLQYYLERSFGGVLTARYENMNARLHDGMVTDLLIGGGAETSRSFARIYIRVADDRVVLVEELSYDDATLLPLEVKRRVNLDDSVTISFVNGNTWIVFEEGGLTFVRLSEDAPIEFAAQPEGPFYKLPLAKQEFISVFGEPMGWYRSRRGRSF